VQPEQIVLGVVLGLFLAGWLASCVVGVMIMIIAIKGRFSR
jgi:hypothetical protein